MHKALAKRVAICQSSAQSARALMHLLGDLVSANNDLRKLIVSSVLLSIDFAQARKYAVLSWLSTS
jgi:hypothetical protein